MWKRDELLAAFRDDRGPTDDAVERMHRRLRELGPVHEGGQVIELAPSRRTSRRVRIAVAAGALAAAAILGWWIRGVTLTPAPAVHGSLAGDRVEEERSESAQVVDDHVRTRDAAAPAPAEQSPTIEVAPTPEPVVVSQRPRSRSAPPRTPAATPAIDESPPADAIAPEPRRDTLAAETAILQRARVELSRGRAQKALSILADHRARFPDAALLEEATAVRTMAQCRLDVTDAARLGAAFVTRFPKSLFRSQVEAACSKAAGE